jgi:hypothetical protein
VATLDQTLKLVITASGTGLSAALTKANAEIGGFAARAKSAIGGISGVFATLGVSLSAGAFAVGIKRMIDGLEELGAASKKSGVAVETLSALKYAAEQSETSFESLQGGLKFLNRTLAEAQRGSREAANELARFGITAGTDTRTALLQIADVFSRLPDGAQKAEAAIKLFGRAGTELIPLLNQGRAGIEGLMREAERLGVVVSGDVTEAADKFNDTLGAIKGAASGFGIALTSQMLGPLQSIATAMKDAATEGKGFWDTLNKFGAGLGKQLFQSTQGPEAIKRQMDEVAEALSRAQDKLNWTPGDDPLGARETIAEIKRLSTELDDLTLRYNRLVREQRAAAEEQDKAGAKPLAIRTITPEQIERLKQEAGEYKKLIKQISDTQIDLKAGAGVDPTKATVLDINRLYIDNALEIIKELSKTGGATKGYLETQLGLLQQLAEEGGKLIDNQINVPFVEDPNASAANVAAAGIAAAQATADANPIVLSYANAGLENPDTIARLAPITDLEGYASGGGIRGPGTGTSDSILARLSAGEYVVRAAAVKNYGIEFLERLNSLRLPKFALGGLAAPSVPAFAGGGPVGTPVHLHIGDHHFETSAAPSVAQQMARIMSTEVLKRGRR